MEIAIQITLNAIIAGAIYSLAALGFNLIYGTTRFFDLGFGAYAVAAAYTVLFLYKTMGLGLVESIICGVLVAGVLGYLAEKIIYRPMRKKKATHTVLLIASIGVLTVLQAFIAIIFSSQFQTLSKNIGDGRIYNISGGVITEVQVLILIAGVLTMGILGWLLNYTMFGKAVRAIADDEEVANIVGINSNRIIGIVFFVSSVIAGMAGIAFGFDTGIQPTMGLVIMLAGVIAAIMGGVGNVYGGFAGAFLLAFVENIGVWYLSGEWKIAIAFGVLIIFLLFKPRGIWPK